MDEDGYVSSGVWKIRSDISIADVVFSVYYLYYLQVGSYDLEQCCSAGMDWSLDQIDNL